MLRQWSGILGGLQIREEMVGECRAGSLRGLDVSFKEDPHGHLHNGLSARSSIAVDLVQADVVLAVASVADLRHCGVVVVVAVRAVGRR
jgi:hypothetical protein